MPDEPAPILSLDAILAADDLQERHVRVPEWGGDVVVRGLTLAQFRRCRRQATERNPRSGEEKVNQDKLDALVCQAGLRQPRITLDQYDKLAEKSAGALVLVISEIMRASGLGEDAAAEAEKSAAD